MGLVIVLYLRPYLLEGDFGVPSYVHREVVLVRHTVLAVDRVRLLNVLERRFETAKGNTNGDNYLAGTVPGSPEVVVVVPADGLGKIVPWAEEINGPGLSVVAGEDAAFGPLFHREILVDPGNGCHHVLPAEPVSVRSVLQTFGTSTQTPLTSRVPSVPRST